MARVILSIVFLLILAVVIVLNIGNVTSFNVFGWKFEGFPVTAVAIVSFVLGVLYSFLFYLFRYFGRIRRQGLAKKGKQLKERELSLNQKEKSLQELIRSRENSRIGGAQPKPSRFALLMQRAKRKKTAKNSVGVENKQAFKGAL